MVKRLPLEQILLILQEAVTQGNIRKVCQQYGVSERSFYRWRSKFSDQLPSDFSPETALARKNEGLEKLVVELTLENRRLRMLILDSQVFRA